MREYILGAFSFYNNIPALFQWPRNSYNSLLVFTVVVLTLNRIEMISNIHTVKNRVLYETET